MSFRYLRIRNAPATTARAAMKTTDAQGLMWFMARGPSAEISGLEGCSSSPVGYIEGWWVDQDLRGSGIGAALVGAAEHWAHSIGLSELASDAELPNVASQAAHRALGEEVDRIVCFRKRLEGAE